MADTEYVKYCPSCGAENSPRELHCACGMPLADVSAEQRCPRQPQVGEDDAAALAESFAGVGPADAGRTTLPDKSRSSAALKCFLESVADPSIRITISSGNSIGSNRKPNLHPADVSLDGHFPGSVATVSGIPTEEVKMISSCHARVFCEDGQWFVQHLGETNYIIVNGAKIRDKREVPIYNGTLLSFTRTQFLVRIDD